MEKINIKGFTRGVILTGALSTLGSAAGVLIAIKKKSGFGYGVGYFFLGGLIGYGLGVTILALTPPTIEDGSGGNNSENGNNSTNGNTNRKLRITNVTNPNNDDWKSVRVFLSEEVNFTRFFGEKSSVIDLVIDGSKGIQSQEIQASDGNYNLFYNPESVFLTDTRMNTVQEYKVPMAKISNPLNEIFGDIF
jgi:hypothetical protein